MAAVPGGPAVLTTLSGQKVVVGGSMPPPASASPTGAPVPSQGVLNLKSPTAPAGLASSAVSGPTSPLTAYATKIATNTNLDPAFVQHLKTLSKADPTFQARLNAEINRVSTQIQSKRDSSTAGIIGQTVEGAVNPLEWAKTAIQSAPDVVHGVGKIAQGNLSGGAKQAGEGALGVAAVIPGLGRLTEGARAGLVARSVEDSAAHIAEQQALAKAEGFGAHIGGKGNPPIVEKGVATPETGGHLGQQVREALPHAPAVRGVQKGDMSAERAQRVQEAQLASEKAGGGTPGHLAAKAALKGAYGRGSFPHLQNLSPEDLHALNQHIDKAPLQFFEKTTAKEALSNAIDHGIAPTEGEQKLLERVFGKVAGADNATQSATSFWDKFVSYTNIPRALRSSGDLSAAFRQGLVVLTTHPGVWARAFAKSVKSFGSEEFYQAQQAAIHNDPWYPLLEKWKVPFTDIGGKDVAHTEEAFIGGQAAEHLHELPGIKGTPVATALRPVSNVIRRSDRAFTGFQNATRFEMAKMLGEKAALLGHDLGDEHLGQSIGKVVGTFSGRGTTPKILEGHLTTLNALMFSPRLMAARMNLISPVYYAKLDPFARAEAMRGARNTVAAIGTFMFVAKALGAQVNFDPRSSNFAKIKVGNTRIDIAGGFSQYVRFIAQEMTREAISSAGHKSHIGWGQHDISDLSNLTKLGRSKAAPIPGLLWDEGSGKDFVGRPIKQGHEAWSNAPFVAQDTVDAYQQKEPSTAIFANAFLSAIGLGVQSYKDKVPKVTGGGGGTGYGDNTGSYGGGGGTYGDSNSGSYGG